ncbi:MAG: DivIVA domain-containing protein [Tissierellaceae bacterium]
MITPLDIQNKEFKKTLWGYKTQEVDSYLDSINEDYEKLYKENIELKDKIGILTDQIRQYNNLEETLKSTLVVAQSTADEVTSSARKKAELIIEDAEISAKNRISNALDEVRGIREEYDKLENEIFMFKTRYESFLKAQLISLEDFHKNFENSIKPNENSKEDIVKDEGLDKMDHLGA